MNKRKEEVYHMLVKEFGASCEICWGEFAILLRPNDLPSGEWIMIHELNDGIHVGFESGNQAIVEYVRESIMEVPFGYPC